MDKRLEGEIEVLGGVEILPPVPLPPKEEKPIWEKMEGESDKFYRKFLIYRDLGPDRSLQKAFIKSHEGGKKVRGSGSWTKLGRKWRWAERCAAWDRHRAEVQGVMERTDRELASTISDRNLLNVAKAISKVLEADNLDSVKLELQKLLALMGKGGAKDLILETYRASQPKPDGKGGTGRMVMLEFDC